MNSANVAAFLSPQASREGRDDKDQAELAAITFALCALPIR